jgi:D-alanyl-lipoteichoic acid acyltransferase DltB (MBOAT superfamily)
MENKKKTDDRLLILKWSLIINIGVLVFFKYWSFLIQNLLGLLSIFHIKTSTPTFSIILPLGLSYYIFQTIGYSLDIYRGSQRAEKNILHFSLFTIFFPKLLVGPIERAKNLLPQFKKSIYFDSNNIIEGSKRIALGLFKKLVVADRILLYQSFVESNSQQQSGTTLLFVSLLYTIQVYADFSGYADIAIGTARLFGFNLMENFKRPLMAKCLSDFWRRWHISLSSWVNDYIFNPISFNKREWGNLGVFFALFISFIIIGVWHGASWNYVFFGFLQAIVLCLEIVTKKFRKQISIKTPSFIYNFISIIFTFFYVSFCLIFFRTSTMLEAFNIIKGILYNTGTLFYDKPSTLYFIAIGCVVIILNQIAEEFISFQSTVISKMNWMIQHLSYAILLIYILLAGVFDQGQFIYFAF